MICDVLKNSLRMEKIIMINKERLFYLILNNINQATA